MVYQDGLSPLGCVMPFMLIFLQMPIFVGLYQALQGSFDLRQSEFMYGLTWIHDLAAPDQLIGFGVNLWVLGPYFNLLPILSIALMVWQMKVHTPPTTNPEQLATQKMMIYMMVIMGFMFYWVPAGLCIYILTSSG